MRSTLTAGPNFRDHLFRMMKPRLVLSVLAFHWPAQSLRNCSANAAIVVDLDKAGALPASDLSKKSLAKARAAQTSISSAEPSVSLRLRRSTRYCKIHVRLPPRLRRPRPLTTSSQVTVSSSGPPSCDLTSSIQFCPIRAFENAISSSFCSRKKSTYFHGKHQGKRADRDKGNVQAPLRLGYKGRLPSQINTISQGHHWSTVAPNGG